MIRRPPRSTLLTHSFPTRRSSDLNIRICDWAYSSWRVFKLAASSPSYTSPLNANSACLEFFGVFFFDQSANRRSEEHTSELQSLMRISYAVFCLKKKKNQQ